MSGRKMASLHGGPATGQQVPIDGATWPEAVCVTLTSGAADRHYKLLGGGVYEDAGPCLENYHSRLPAKRRCPDCGGAYADQRDHTS